MTKSRTATGQPNAGRSSASTQKIGTTRTLETVRDDDGQVTSRVRRTVLPGGLRVVTEQMAGARSASIGVWVGVGSRDETAALHGCSSVRRWTLSCEIPFVEIRRPRLRPRRP